MIKNMRLVHLCLGMFFTPTIIFFSITGAFQIFGLHESQPQDAFQTPEWLAALAEIHKNQAFKLPQNPEKESIHETAELNQMNEAGPRKESKKESKNESQNESQKAQGPRTNERPKKHTSIPLKWLFLLLAIGLTVTSLVGIYMAFAYKRDRKLVLGLLTAGIILPITLLFL
jgi:hypothetical protein